MPTTVETGARFVGAAMREEAQGEGDVGELLGLHYSGNDERCSFLEKMSLSEMHFSQPTQRVKVGHHADHGWPLPS